MYQVTTGFRTLIYLINGRHRIYIYHYHHGHIYYSIYTSLVSCLFYLIFLSLLKDRWFIMTHSDQQERQRDIHPIHSYASSRSVDYIWTRNLAKSGWRTRGGDCPDLQRWKPSSGNAYRTNKVKTVIDKIWVNFYCHLYRLAQIPAPDSSVVRATDQRFRGPRCKSWSGPSFYLLSCCKGKTLSQRINGWALSDHHPRPPTRWSNYLFGIPIPSIKQKSFAFKSVNVFLHIEIICMLPVMISGAYTGFGVRGGASCRQRISWLPLTLFWQF